MNTNKKKLPKHYSKLFPMLIFVATIFMSIGYASLNSITLDIKGTVLIQATNGVFISSVISSGEYTSYQTVLHSKVVLDNELDSYATYTVTIKNNSSDNYKYTGTFYSLDAYDNPNITFDIVGLEEGHILNGNELITFDVIFHYKDECLNNSLESYLNFDFKKVHHITYIGFENDIDEVDICEDELLEINVDATNINIEPNTSYTYQNNVLRLFNVKSDIVIYNSLITSDKQFTYDEDIIYGLAGTAIVEVPQNAQFYYSKIKPLIDVSTGYYTIIDGALDSVDNIISDKNTYYTCLSESNMCNTIYVIYELNMDKTKITKCDKYTIKIKEN